MEKRKKLKIDRNVLRELREAELGRVAGGLTACGPPPTCTDAGLTGCTTRIFSQGC